jgi:hypothetical protein
MQQERETGQSVLKLGQVFHEKVLFIKKHLAQKTQHPIRVVIEKFKSFFHDSNVMLLCKSAGAGVESDLNMATGSEKIDFVQRMITKTIGIFIDAIILFY